MLVGPLKAAINKGYPCAPVKCASVLLLVSTLCFENAHSHIQASTILVTVSPEVAELMASLSFFFLLTFVNRSD